MSRPMTRPIEDPRDGWLLDGWGFAPTEWRFAEFAVHKEFVDCPSSEVLQTGKNKNHTVRFCSFQEIHSFCLPFCHDLSPGTGSGPRNQECNISASQSDHHDVNRVDRGDLSDDPR